MDQKALRDELEHLVSLNQTGYAPGYARHMKRSRVFRDQSQERSRVYVVYLEIRLRVKADNTLGA